MKRLATLLIILVMAWASTAMAAPIFYQATDVEGQGTITGYADAYGNPLDTPPTFSFLGTTGDVDYNFDSFLPGEYQISFLLEGFWVDINEDDTPDLTSLIPSNFAATTPSFTVNALPHLSGTQGQLTWNIDLTAGGSITYDFLSTGTYTNQSVNSILLGADILYGGQPYDTMTANIGWDTLRVELNPVPEPGTLLLLGSGLLGLCGLGYRRKKNKV